MEDFDDIFNDDEIDRILHESGRKTISKRNINRETKEIGDRVRILDYSSLSYPNGVELDPDDYDAMNPEDYYVVIETRLKKEKKSIFGRYKQDLMIAHPTTKRIFRVSSIHVEIAYVYIIT
jgi:hypothetical protein